MFTHEQFIQSVASIAVSRLNSDERAKLADIKLAYGAGSAGLRGVTFYDRWGKADTKAPFVEVCAFGQESLCQLAGTTIHELGHVLAGFGAGHGKDWKEACAKLGLRRILAAGTQYRWAMFSPDIRAAVAYLPKPDDGAPVSSMFTATGRAVAPKPCTSGIGTRGGKSRGIGSGSRLRLFVCECVPPLRVRIARDEFDCTCNTCAAGFVRQ